MTKLVVFQLDGDFELGFKVSAEIFLEDNSFDGRKLGELPSEPQLLKHLEAWQLEYRKLDHNQRIKGKKVIITSGHSQNRLYFRGEQLKKRFQQWLRAKPFQDLNLWLREKLNTQESIRMLLCSDCQKVHQLPWNQWDFVQRYSHLEIALSPLDITEIAPVFTTKPRSQVRILAILGTSDRINIEQDLKILTTLEDTYLEPLIEPQREVLYDRLWSECWDIVFFAGHSETIAGQGILYLNPQDILTIADLEYALQKAISGGLQLAIFNSCNGLGLAYALGQLALPQIIVMREPIIDSVAQKFLGYFLAEYSSGQPLHLATRKARERLQALEEKYPYSSWLPVLYQNQSAQPLLWSELVGTQEIPHTSKKQKSSQNYTFLILISAIVSCLLWFGQTMGWLQATELDHYDRALRFRPIDRHNDKVLVITIDDEDINYQAKQGMTMRGSLADEALAQLLVKLQPSNPIAIASDIIHDFDYSPQLSQIIARQDNFVGICRIKNEESQLASIKPPPNLAVTQIGFTNMAIDLDSVIRRQILGMSPDSQCQSDMSLSLRMALKYLDYVGLKTYNQPIYPRQFTEDGFLKIGNLIFPKIEFDSGAYQLPKTENRGYQILLNYASKLPQSISLREILRINSTQKLSRLVDKRIIFIGVKSHNSDLYYTPYSNKKQFARLSGVFIHAQGTTQIINAVLNQQKLIRWFSTPWELVWIFSWGFVSSLLVAFTLIIISQKSHLLITIAVVIASCLVVLYLSYLSLLITGYWLPLIAPALALLFTAFSSLFFRMQPKQDVSLNSTDIRSITWLDQKQKVKN